MELCKRALGLLLVCVDDRVDERDGCTLAKNFDTIKEMTHKPKNIAKIISTFDLQERDLERLDMCTGPRWADHETNCSVSTGLMNVDR